jgi:hypothetical protein
VSGGIYDNYNFIYTQTKECVMKRTFALLVMALALLFMLVSAVPAVVTPLGGPHDPVGGSNDGEDGDHPWGGDRVILGSSGSPSTRIVRTSILTGYPAVDIFIYNVLEYLAPQENKRDALIVPLNSPSRAGCRFSLSREDQR